MELTNILDEAKKCFNSARQNLILGAKYLHEIKEKKLWQDNFSTFGDFVESECQISEGQASKLVKVFDYYSIQGGLAENRLEGVDMEKLYLATNLEGSPEQQLETAKVLKRKEIQEQVREDKHGVCDHEGEPYELFRRYACGKWEKHEEINS